MIVTARPAIVFGEAESIDFKTLAKKTRPAVMLLVVSDASGKEIATGTGFIVSADGKLITNNHVIEKAASVIAKSENGGLFPVKGILVDDPKNDLALLKLEGKELPFLKLSNAVKIEVGTRIAVVGSPLGLEGTLSEGIVSAVRDLQADMKLLQVTAAISPGSSGSPVLNANGEVVAVATTQVREGQALNFAVPSEYVNALLLKAKTVTEPTAFRSKASTGEGEPALKLLSDQDFWAFMHARTEKDSAQMLKSAKELIERYPNSATCYALLGQTYNHMSFWDDAVAACQQSVKIRPEGTPGWICLGGAYRGSGRTEDAIAACRQAIKLEPHGLVQWFLLGDICFDSQKWDDAIAAYNQISKIIPDDASVWSKLGKAYRESGRIEDAIVAFRQLAKIEPDSAYAWILLANTCARSEKWDEAIAAYRRIVTMDPKDAYVWHLMGISCRHRGKLDDAAIAGRQAIKIKPDFAAAWFELGLTYEQAGMNREATTAYRRAIQLDPNMGK